VSIVNGRFSDVIPAGAFVVYSSVNPVPGGQPEPEPTGGATAEPIPGPTDQPTSVPTPSPINPAGNAAVFVSQSIPLTLTAGASATATITYRNEGSTTWTNSGQYRLGTQSPQDNTIFGTHRAFIGAGESVAPGQSKTFTFPIQAPTTLGTYAFQVRPVQDGVEWFGPASTLVEVRVISAESPTPVPTQDPAPMPPHPGTISAGFFKLAEDAIYSTDGSHYCHITSWENYLLMGGQADLSNVQTVSSIPSSMVNDGICPSGPPPAPAPEPTPAPASTSVNPGSIPAGFFKLSGDAIYYSNGSQYCHLTSWEQFLGASGQPDLSNVLVAPSIPASMSGGGPC
jgi:hypothetical protein